MLQVLSFGQKVFLGNTLRVYITALCLFFILRFTFIFFHKYVGKYIKRLITKSQKKRHIGTVLLECLDGIPGYFYSAIALYIPFTILNTPSEIHTALTVLFFLTIGTEIVHISYKFLHYFIHTGLIERKKTVDKSTEETINLIIKIVVRVIGAMLILINLGINISPLLASLGIGGIAI